MGQQKALSQFRAEGSSVIQSCGLLGPGKVVVRVQGGAWWLHRGEGGVSPLGDREEVGLLQFDFDSLNNNRERDEGLFSAAVDRPRLLLLC